MTGLMLGTRKTLAGESPQSWPQTALFTAAGSFVCCQIRSHRHFLPPLSPPTHSCVPGPCTYRLVFVWPGSCPPLDGWRGAVYAVVATRSAAGRIDVPQSASCPAHFLACLLVRLIRRTFPPAVGNSKNNYANRGSPRRLQPFGQFIFPPSSAAVLMP